MKLREIFRFEFAYQLRSVSVWLYFALQTGVAFLFIRENYSYDARGGEFFVNAPFIIANIACFGSLLLLLMTASIAGDAAARDVETRMHSLTYAAPVGKAKYLGGRFLAAFFLNALLLLALPVGIELALRFSDLEPEILGPFRADSYLTAYFFIALPNAFVGTTLQFSFAALTRRATGAYLGSLLVFVASYIVTPVVFILNPGLARLTDPLGSADIQEMSNVWTPIELDTRLIALEGTFLWNRLLWFGIALGALAFTYLRFRLVHHTASGRLSRFKRRTQASPASNTGSGSAESISISVQHIAQTFGFAIRLRQTLAVAWESFGTIARSRNALVVMSVVALFLVIILPLNMKHMGVPFFPRTEYVLTFLTAPLTDSQTPWVIVPLLIIFWTGELVWRERDANLSDIAAAAPVPEWILFLGKFTGLGLMLVVWLALLTIAGVLAQTVLDYRNYEIGLYLKVLFGLQLPEYLLFACLAFALHVLVNQKHLGYLAALVAYGCIAFAPGLGVEHHLLVYGSSPNWSYTDMRGFGATLAPWLCFKLYWAAWALLLAVVAKLFWVRSRESSFKSRLELARSRFGVSAASGGAAAVLLIIAAGGFVFYNTNVLNEYRTASKTLESRAEYERRYAQYRNIPQPRIAATDLQVEIFPERQAADVRGAYRLVNKSDAVINSVHLATSPEVETGEISFDRPAALALADEEYNHRIYTLDEPLQPGDALNLNFAVRFESKGFRNSGANVSVLENGSYFKNLEWFPAVGYQPERELSGVADRKTYNLPARPEIPSLDDAEARGLRADGDRIEFRATVGTMENQIAVAPGTLRRTWTENNRRYFEYAATATIRNEYAFFSADYAVREARWNNVAIQVFHHPAHTANVERILRGAQAALEYHSKRFGAYPNDYLRFVERPGDGIGMHSDTTTIDYSEGSSRFDPESDGRDFDFVSAVVAHEVAHQWWGGKQLTPAYVEGAPLLSESLAWYTALGVMREGLGGEYEQRLLSFMRETYETPRSLAAAPLLRASGWFLGYRKGPLALYALDRYIGEERVTLALRRLLEKHGTGKPPLPTSLDLYRELQAVTPDEHRRLLRDFFETNAFWELKTERARVVQTSAAAWQVTLDVEARKTAVDEKGGETELPTNDWIEIGVFAPAEKDESAGKPLYLQMHRIGSGKQTITVTVPSKPDSAGVDPRFLLIDLRTDNNVRKVKVE